ncbi:MAG: RecT family recombinase [Pseudomonadota bacterium]
MSEALAVVQPKKGIIEQMAERYDLDPKFFHKTLSSTIMPSNQNVSNEQLCAFLLVAKQYDLNPFVKEIYAFPNKGGIQPIVSIDGWMKIINDQPTFDGMNFKDELDAEGKLISVTCVMYRKDRKHPIEVTEYMSECKKNSEPWNKWPARMLRHKATIQAARYAFGLSGIMEPDEAERLKEINSSYNPKTVESVQELERKILGEDEDDIEAVLEAKAKELKAEFKKQVQQDEWIDDDTGEIVNG